MNTKVISEEKRWRFVRKAETDDVLITEARFASAENGIAAQVTAHIESRVSHGLDIHPDEVY